MSNGKRNEAINDAIKSDLSTPKKGFCSRILAGDWGGAAAALINDNPESKLAEQYADAIWEG